MRKRSGALHSDSSEEFMLLAEYSHEKTGYFYDESLHKEVKQKVKSKFKRVPSVNETPIQHNFDGFDFAAHNEQSIQEKEQLWAHSHTIQINLVLICENPLKIRKKLIELWPQDNMNTSVQQKRQLDLFVHSIKQQGHQHIHCYKFWILDITQCDNEIYTSYLSRAKKILRIGDGGNDWINQNEVKGKVFECVSSLTD